MSQNPASKENAYGAILRKFTLTLDWFQRVFGTAPGEWPAALDIGEVVPSVDALQLGWGYPGALRYFSVNQGAAGRFDIWPIPATPAAPAGQLLHNSWYWLIQLHLVNNTTAATAAYTISIEAHNDPSIPAASTVSAQNYILSGPLTVPAAGAGASVVAFGMDQLFPSGLVPPIPPNHSLSVNIIDAVTQNFPAGGSLLANGFLLELPAGMQGPHP